MDDLPHSRAEYFRNVAERLRGLATNQIDLRRGDQLRALAGGFDRFADRLKQQMNADD